MIRCIFQTYRGSLKISIQYEFKAKSENNIKSITIKELTI